jgi:hypothetical protein
MLVFFTEQEATTYHPSLKAVTARKRWRRVAAVGLPDSPRR